MIRYTPEQVATLKMLWPLAQYSTADIAKAIGIDSEQQVGYVGRTRYKLGPRPTNVKQARASRRFVSVRPTVKKAEVKKAKVKLPPPINGNSKYGYRWERDKAELFAREWEKGTALKIIALMVGKTLQQCRHKRQIMGLEPRTRKGVVRRAVKVYLTDEQILTAKRAGEDLSMPWSRYVQTILERGLAV